MAGPTDPVHLPQRNTKELIFIYQVSLHHPHSALPASQGSRWVSFSYQYETQKMQVGWRSFPGLKPPLAGLWKWEVSSSRVLRSVLHIPRCWDSGRIAEMSPFKCQNDIDKQCVEGTEHHSYQLSD